MTDGAAELRAATDRWLAHIEAACEVLHDAYEKGAVETGWETQHRSRTTWAGLPEANKATVRIAVAHLIAWMEEDDD